MKTLLTILLTFLLVNTSNACYKALELRRLDEKLSFTSPKECSNILNTMPNKEISSSLVSKYGNCINSHFSKITGTLVDGKVKFFPSSGYVGMNIDDLIKVTDNKFNGYRFFGKWKYIAGVVQWGSLSDDDNPFEWYASSEDGYNFIYASRFLGWRANGCYEIDF